MQQTITAKLQILVNPSDKQILCDTMRAYSDACNYVSEYIYKTHNLSRYSVQEDTYYQVREVYGLRSQMAVSCVRTVIAKYKTILIRSSEFCNFISFYYYYSSSSSIHIYIYIRIFCIFKTTNRLSNTTPKFTIRLYFI